MHYFYTVQWSRGCGVGRRIGGRAMVQATGWWWSCDGPKPAGHFCWWTEIGGDEEINSGGAFFNFFPFFLCVVKWQQTLVNPTSARPTTGLA